MAMALQDQLAKGSDVGRSLDAFDFERPPVRDGARLHSEVPAERWCVTRRDLLQLRALVQRRVAEGRVEPTDKDPFVVSDDAIGPSVYTVTSQLIRPITRRAGGASWALMLRPEGLFCDLFVTHAWAEGIYEFIDKVLYSWPAPAHHAYCCMLSMPQCLDISSLISSPWESPFARALLAAPCTLVVPNRTGSIYARVWCAYEAFLAYSASKDILTASAPVPHLAHHLTVMCLVIVAGFCLCVVLWYFGALLQLEGFRDFDLELHGSVSMLGLSLVAVARPAPWTRVVLFTTAVASGYALAAHVTIAVELATGTCARGYPYTAVVGSLLFSLACGIATVLAEADRLLETQNRYEAKQLRNGYTGSIRDAVSSVPEDQARIMAEVAASGLEDGVDQAIEVLLVSGASTPALRATMLRTGLLEQASHHRVSMAFFGWAWLSVHIFWVPSLWIETQIRVCPYLEACQRHVQPRACAFELVNATWVAHALTVQPGMCASRGWSLLTSADFETYVCVFGCFEVLLMLAMYFYIPEDTRNFAVRLTTLTMGASMTPMFIARALVGDLGEYALSHWLVQLEILVAVPATLAMSAAGPARVASIPWGGPWLVQQLMGQLRCRGSAMGASWGQLHEGGSSEHEFC